MNLIITEMKSSNKDCIVLEERQHGRIFSLSPKQFADERVTVIPRCLSSPLVVFEPEVLLKQDW